MIAYVESNFILEIALGQEQSKGAEGIVTLAERGDIEIAFPSFAKSEPFSTVSNRGRERQRLYAGLTTQLNELARSIPHQRDVTTLRPLVSILTDVGTREDDLLVQTVERLLEIGRLIPLDSQCFALSRELRSKGDLTGTASIILASVWLDLPLHTIDERKWFISRNWKDFADAYVVDKLHRHNCRNLDHFEKALDEIQSTLAKQLARSTAII